ncbi:MAG TPA: glycosyltransferase family 1 protein [Burkholderiales bacterium]|nr:glycosyltransferase family 1 protein [Burkholderiales bacterium]
MRKRIAIISDHASPLAAAGGVDSGGQNVYIAQVARHLARLGYRVDVFTRRDGEDLPEVLEWRPGIRVVHVPAGPAAFVRKEELLPLMGEFAAYVRDFARRNGGYRISHANFFMSGLASIELKRALGVPYVVTFHALGRVRRLHQGDADQFPPERLEIEDQVIADADAVIAECPQDFEDLTRLYRADPARVRIIPCGFDKSEFWPITRTLARRTLGWRPDERILLNIGRLVPRKGIDNAIRGVARLARDHGIEARLVVVGGNSDLPDPALTPEIGRLQKLAAAEGIADRVLFTGRRSREFLKLYYSAADIFITTPWYEPFGITPLEAMACGTPVLGADVGGIRYSVADGETGRLVPPNDPDALAARLAELYGDPARLRALGRNGLKRVHSLFTWQKVARSVAGCYEQAVREPYPLSGELACHPSRTSPSWSPAAAAA